ncbi:biopolymer transporter ExbD [Helicobacter mustelae]|uniref:ExbD\tolR family transport protein n=1 Tax=Helicobacter mustelae (strain ATCC 43772 / CCUG 25715 / CIP 103759 / LMG 18044 / NCTC 12198 / R85-136P) TaxID=679897 RepID=D3UGS9_HELM1|nr:biopolymer transporter ExbD [Helicobacter mustelae]CBG39700.1 exbD\tolR family transport protein [Helicobacter mustelae 12198]SQH71206.1 ExbD/TolR family transport protein [Helicobacter mustelae]STP12333.1 ExbD/TolR family transport protein [Helicobacter mustelae]
MDWEEKPELNITPLVDIMLVLLAILMVTTPTVVYKEQITLPQGSKQSRVGPDDKLEVRMDIHKRIYIGKDIFDLATFPDNFNLLAGRYNKSSNVYIRADKKLQYQDIIFLLKSVKEAGFSKVSLVTTN